MKSPCNPTLLPFNCFSCSRWDIPVPIQVQVPQERPSLGMSQEHSHILLAFGFTEEGHGAPEEGISRRLPTPQCSLLSESESGHSSDSLDALGKDGQAQEPPGICAITSATGHLNQRHSLIK